MTHHPASHDGGRDMAVWAINGRYITQPATGVQRYAHEIVAALDQILQQDGGAAKHLWLRLVLAPGAKSG